MTIRVGIQVQPQHATYQQMRATWRRVEEIGADTLFNWDHFFPLSGDPDGAHFECWTLLAAMAEVTTRVQFGALVTCNSYRNPNLLADMARTVDQISGGRVDPRHRQRLVRPRLRGIRVRVRHRSRPVAGARRRDAGDPRPAWQAESAAGARRPDPDPDRRGGEKVTLRIVAQHADIWHDFGDPEAFARKSRVLDDWCRRVGRDPATIARSVSLDALDEARAEQFVAQGVSELLVEASGPDYDLSDLEKLVQWRDRHHRNERDRQEGIHRSVT